MISWLWRDIWNRFQHVWNWISYLCKWFYDEWIIDDLMNEEVGPFESENKSCIMFNHSKGIRWKNLIILVILLHAHTYNIIIMQISERITSNLASHPRPCVIFISLILSSTDKDSSFPILKHLFHYSRNPLPLYLYSFHLSIFPQKKYIHLFKSINHLYKILQHFYPKLKYIHL